MVEKCFKKELACGDNATLTASAQKEPIDKTAAWRWRKAVVRSEIANYDRAGWLFRHVELCPDQDYLSPQATLLLRRLSTSGFCDRKATLELLLAIRTHYVDWAQREICSWANPAATRRRHLDALKVLYLGELRTFGQRHRAALQARTLGDLMFGRAGE